MDRRRLEGGDDWEREINAAIANCTLFLISISQPAVDSQYVQQEFAEAERLSKRIIPLLYRDYSPTHPWINAVGRLNWVEFKDTHAYALSLKRLLYAIQDPTLDLGANDDALYSRALTMRASDPERAAILLQHLIDRTPAYFGGQAQRDLATLETRLYASRIARLRAQAQEARQQGQYGVEAASLEALIALGNRDAQAYTWAQEYLPIAQQNHAVLGPYGVIQERVADGDLATARDMLQNLWKQAPYFRDPANLAPGLNLTVPPTYEEVKAAEERAAAAAERKRQEEAEHQHQAATVAAERDRQTAQVANERSHFSRACNLLESNHPDYSETYILSSLRDLNYDHIASTASDLVTRIIDARQQGARLSNESKTAEEKRLAFAKGFGDKVTITTVICVVIAVVLGGCSLLLGATESTSSVTAGQSMTSWLVTAIVEVLLMLVIYLAIIGSFALRRASLVVQANSLKAEMQRANANADTTYQRWRQLAEQVLQQRVDAINRE